VAPLEEHDDFFALVLQRAQPCQALDHVLDQKVQCVADTTMEKHVWLLCLHLLPHCLVRGSVVGIDAAKVELLVLVQHTVGVANQEMGVVDFTSSVNILQNLGEFPGHRHVVDDCHSVDVGPSVSFQRDNTFTQLGDKTKDRSVDRHVQAAVRQLVCRRHPDTRVQAACGARPCRTPSRRCTPTTQAALETHSAPKRSSWAGRCR